MMLVLLAGPSVASEPEYLLSEEVLTGVEVESPLDFGFEDPVLFRRYRELRGAKPPFRRDSNLDANLRSYWLRRDIKGAPDREALALGGELLLSSGWYRDTASVQAGAYTSQPIYAPDDKDGTDLLRPGQKGYSVLGKLNLQLQLRETRVTLFRGELNTPFANKRDIRMTPILFENYNLVSRDIDKLDIFASVVTAYKPQTSTKFIGLLTDISPSADSDMYIAGVRYRPAGEQSVGAIYYRVPDYLEIAYAEGQFDTTIAELPINFAGQYIHQSSIGGEVGGPFRSNAGGLKVELKWGATDWTLAWHRISGDEVRTDFGFYPGYNAVLVREFNRANEETFRLGLNYSFDQRIDGLKLLANMVWGNRPGSLDDESEFDLTIRYEFATRFPMNLQIRYARVRGQREMSAGDIDDFRAIFNYQIPVF